MKWLSWTNLVLGLWLILAPFALGYSSASAVVEDVLLGIVIAGFALWRALGPEVSGMRGASWIVALAGLWVLIAPFVIGYTALPSAVGNDVVVGFVVMVLGAIRALAPVRATTPPPPATE